MSFIILVKTILAVTETSPKAGRKLRVDKHSWVCPSLLSFVSACAAFFLLGTTWVFHCSIHRAVLICRKEKFPGIAIVVLLLLSLAESNWFIFKDSCLISTLFKSIQLIKPSRTKFGNLNNFFHFLPVKISKIKTKNTTNK